MSARWIEFMSLGTSPSGKTERWGVLAKQGGAVLGEVRWFGRWRRYAFFPFGDTVFERDCLRDIATFLDEQTVQQRARPAGGSR